jgi:hypothetical protein
VTRRPLVGSGLAQAPTMMLTGAGSTGFDGEAPFASGVGGAFIGVDATGSRATVPTRLLGTEDKPGYADWGTAVKVSYPVQRDAYDVATSWHGQWGWQGGFPPIGANPLRPGPQ